MEYRDLVPNVQAIAGDYAGQLSLRVSGWRKSPAAWFSFWSLGSIERDDLFVGLSER
jgi:hypothetical protein